MRRSEGLTLQQSEGFDMFLLGTQCWLLGSNEYCFQSTQVCPVPGFGQHPEMILNVLAHCTQARTWVFEMACYGAIRFWWCKNIGILPGASPCLLGGGGWWCALCQTRWNVLLYSLFKSLGCSADVAVSTVTTKKINNITDLVSRQMILSTSVEHVTRGKATNRFALALNALGGTINAIPKWGCQVT